MIDDGPEAAFGEQPPAESEHWGADEWMAWFATHPEPEPSPGPRPHGRRASIGTQMLAGAMFAVSEVIYGKQDHGVTIVQTVGEPDDDEPITVHLDWEDPRASYVVIRDDEPAGGD